MTIGVIFVKGYMKQLIPDDAPENPENWEDIVKDIERVIMPGVCISNKKYYIL